MTFTEGLTIEKVDREEFPWVVREPNPMTIHGWSIALFIREEDARAFVDARELRGRVDALLKSWSKAVPAWAKRDLEVALNPPKEGT